MTPEARNAAATLCPSCHGRTLPDPFVYSVVASYTCETCGTGWSARLRNGRPDVHLYPPSAVARTEADAIAPLGESPRPRHDLDRGTYETALVRERVQERMR
jgi:hypothetical protein